MPPRIVAMTSEKPFVSCEPWREIKEEGKTLLNPRERDGDSCRGLVREVHLGLPAQEPDPKNPLLLPFPPRPHQIRRRLRPRCRLRRLRRRRQDLRPLLLLRGRIPNGP